MQTFTAPINTSYKIECWGASGGWGGRKIAPHVPLGGYAIGYIVLSKGTTLYVCVGGKGEDAPPDGYTQSYVPCGGNGGYNGGGDGGNAAANGYGNWFDFVRGGGGGGGATHIANIDKGILSNYSDLKDKILLVAGGAGGLSDWVHYWGLGSSGGGESGEGGFGDSEGHYAGGTQNTGYAFGQGANALDEPNGFGNGIGEGDGGGGGGWYGGYACSISKEYNHGDGGGGSGHINSTLITNGSMLNGVREGNGYARISWISPGLEP